MSKTIKELNLAGNGIGDEGAAIVTDALKSKQNQQLSYLSLSDNRITSVGAK
jgi:Ran GTPase-activating protein (RanGAP) involved in mRNA processing and transport